MNIFDFVNSSEFKCMCAEYNLNVRSSFEFLFLSILNDYITLV